MRKTAAIAVLMVFVVTFCTISVVIASTSGEATVGNSPPKILIENFESDNELVDLKSDNANTYSQLDTNLTIYVSDLDGREDLESTRLLIRDNNDTVVENVDIWENRVIVDGDTYKFTLENFNPSSDNLGSWDLGAWAKDSTGNENQAYDSGTFSVDDGDITLTLEPNTELGFAKTLDYNASGSIGLVKGEVSTSSGKVIDEYSGSKDISGASYSEDFTIEADVGDNVTVTSYASVNGAVDGQVKTTYEVNDNQQYTIYLRWEDNYELVSESYLDNSEVHLSAHFENYTTEIDLENNPENILLQGAATPYKATIRDNDKYSRTRLNFGTGKITFILNSSPAILGEYTITFEDHTGKYKYPNGEIWLLKNYENKVMHVDERKITPDYKAYPILEPGTDYRYIVVNTKTGENRHFSTETFPRTQVKTIVIKPEGVPPENYALENTSWSVERDNENIEVSYKDNLGVTDSVAVRIHPSDNEDNVIYENTVTTNANDFSCSASGCSTSKSYSCSLEVNREGRPSATVEKSIASVYPDEMPKTAGVPNLGFPIALASIGGLGLLFVLIGSFTRARKEIDLAMLVGGIAVPTLKLVGEFMGIALMPIPPIAVGLIAALGVGYYVGVKMG